VGAEHAEGLTGVGEASRPVQADVMRRAHPGSLVLRWYTETCIVSLGHETALLGRLALQDLRAFPRTRGVICGHEFTWSNKGLSRMTGKAMTSVGPGVYELRIRTAVEHRVFYVAKFAEGVYVLHCISEKDAADCPTGP